MDEWIHHTWKKGTIAGMTSVFVFYGRFAAAYGTCWFVALLLALLTRSRIDTGAFGLVGFPLIGVFYATIRVWVRVVPAGEAGRGFEVIQTRRVGGVDDESAEEILARRLGSRKTFVVRGVNRQTQADRTLQVTADSKESAGIQAELEGLIVISVDEQ
jgi:hypothetical protein